jgi:trk system potassium uptake protein
MRLGLVISVIGQLLVSFSVVYAIPFAMCLWDQDWADAGHYLLAGLVNLAIGWVASRNFERPRVFYRAEALAVVAFTWLVVSFLAAIPFVFAGLQLEDALFEAMSGLTGTGATILTDFSGYSRGFFLWRAMTQWFGGLGVIALFVVVLPRLGIAGRQLFFAEASGAPGEAISVHVRDAASKLWMLYVLLTLLCVVGLWLTGMPVYDAICHALTAVSAGGFSPNGSSLAGYANPRAEWLLVGFMFLAGASFPLQVKVYSGDWKGFYRDGEFMFYLGVNAVVGLLVAVALMGMPGMSGWTEAFRLAFFQSTSLSSGTGFASADYAQWNDPAQALLVLIMLVGGCAGSAAGGAKCIRHLLVSKHLFREITQVLHPRAVLPIVYKNHLVPAEIMRAVFTLCFLYAGGYFLLGIILTITGNDPITGFTAALSCLGNIGHGLAEVGPMGSFAGFSPQNKLLLTGAMWVGRLEIVTVLALLHPDVWMNIQLKRK